MIVMGTVTNKNTKINAWMNMGNVYKISRTSHIDKIVASLALVIIVNAILTGILYVLENSCNPAITFINGSPILNLNLKLKIKTLAAVKAF